MLVVMRRRSLLLYTPLLLTALALAVVVAWAPGSLSARDDVTIVDATSAAPTIVVQVASPTVQPTPPPVATPASAPAAPPRQKQREKPTPTTTSPDKPSPAPPPPIAGSGEPGRVRVEPPATPTPMPTPVRVEPPATPTPTPVSAPVELPPAPTPTPVPARVEPPPPPTPTPVPARVEPPPPVARPVRLSPIGSAKPAAPVKPATPAPSPKSTKARVELVDIQYHYGSGKLDADQSDLLYATAIKQIKKLLPRLEACGREDVQFDVNPKCTTRAEYWQAIPSEMMWISSEGGGKITSKFSTHCVAKYLEGASMPIGESYAGQWEIKFKVLRQFHPNPAGGELCPYKGLVE